MADAVVLPNSSHIVVSMSDTMELNILSRDDAVVLPRVVIEGDSDDEEEKELTAEEVAELEAKLGGMIVKSDDDEKEGEKKEGDDDEEWEDEAEDDDDVTPFKETLECKIDPEHAPKIYENTTTVDIDDLAFPGALAGIAALAPQIESIRIKSVPSSGYLGDWPLTVKKLVVWQDQMNYDYGPYADSDDEDDSDEDEEEEEENEEKKGDEGKEDDEENDPDYVPGDDEDSDDEEDILCTSRLVLNITPSDAKTPRVTKAFEQMIRYLPSTLEEVTIIFNVDPEYKQPKDYVSAADDYEPLLLGFLLTLLTMCGNDDTKVTFVDFDKTGTQWLLKDDDAATSSAKDLFNEFMVGSLNEVREEAKADGFGDVGTKRDIAYISRDEYKAAVGDECFLFDTKWEK